MIQYKFSKGYYIQGTGNEYHALELITVHADSARGRYAYSYDQSRGAPRDYQNRFNDLGRAEEYIAERVARVSFRPDESIASAREKISKFIDPKNQYLAFDAEIASDINAREDYHQQLVNAEYYKRALMALSRFEPAGVQAILTGAKYPFSAAMHDFASGISHKQIKQDIAKLPAPVVKRLREFASQRNYILSFEACNTEAHDYIDSVARNYPKINHSPERVDFIIARAVDDLLRDALEYKYYQRTGNMGIFVGASGQKVVDALSDKGLLEAVGWNAMQNYGSALQVARRMKQIIAAERDITPFMTELNKVLGDGYVNQDIIRIMFDTLSPHYNKFKHNKKVTEFIGRLQFYAKDARLATHMAETFGLKDAPKPNKDKARAKLTDAAKRIAAGDNISGVVVIDREQQLVRDFAVEPTSETYGRIKKSIKPTAVQAEILKKYGANQK